MQRGLSPPKDIKDPVQLRPREYNKRADYLCNQALDKKSSFSHVDGESELKFYKSIGASWLAYSDGGGRGDG